jgi:predicted nucleic acid-binding protein
MTDEQAQRILRRTHLDPYSPLAPRFLGVVDTNALLSSVDNDCRNPGRRSRLLRMTDGGTAVLYAADHVYSEVYEKLPKIAESSPVSLAGLRARFEERYLPVLRFVDVSTADIADPQVLAITDPDDVPTGQLAKLVGPCVVFSADKHLRKPGFAPADWLAVAKFAVDLADGIATQNATGQIAVLPAWGLIELVSFVGRKTGISPLLLTGAVLAAGVLLFRSPERRTAVGRYAIPVVQALAKMMAEGFAQEVNGSAGVREAILASPEAPSVKQQVAIVLARQPEPLLAKEIQQRIERLFPVDFVPTVSEVRAVLKNGSEFVAYQRYRWQFGREAAPWQM